MLDNKIQTIKLSMQKLLEELASINDENFASKIELIKNSVRVLSEEREKLIEEYELSLLKKYEPELLEIAKLIDKRLDNIIKIKKDQQVEINLQLENIQNQKKIAIYTR